MKRRDFLKNSAVAGAAGVAAASTLAAPAIAAGRKALELQPEYELAKNNLQWALDRREQSQKR